MPSVQGGDEIDFVTRPRHLSQSPPRTPTASQLDSRKKNISPPPGFNAAIDYHPKHQHSSPKDFIGPMKGDRYVHTERQCQEIPPVIARLPPPLNGRPLGRGRARFRQPTSEPPVSTNTVCYVGMSDAKEQDENKFTTANSEILKEMEPPTTFSAALDRQPNFVQEVEKMDKIKLAPPAALTSNTGSSAVPFSFGHILNRISQAESTRWQNFPPMKKDFYEEHLEVQSMSALEADRIRCEMNRISVEDLSTAIGSRHIPNPITKFEHAFHKYPELLKELAHFQQPSPIQCQAWPIALSGMDFIGIAQTGTGKTLAFLLPAFIHIDNQPVPRKERCGPSCLILSPTRELALQIESEVAKYHYRGITSICVYGGGDRKQQVNTCVSGVDIVIATPGRLNDLVYNRIIKVESITFLVLDEADRMLDMGFEPQIQKILMDIRPDRHTIMTSATWPEAVRRLGCRYTKEPFLITVGSLDLSACHSVNQQVLFVDRNEKERILFEFVKNLKDDDKVIVFVAKKDQADHLSTNLSLRSIDCTSMHGNRDQKEREQALKDIKNGTVRVLVATDLVARGLDILDINYVFNFDFPRNIEEYVHRVGRTGRAGKTGTSITLVTREDWRHAADLIGILVEANQNVIPELYQMAERYARKMESTGGLYGRGGNCAR